MGLKYTNHICPKCNNPNYMVSLVGVSDIFQYKCMNCNSYFTYDDFTSRANADDGMVKVVRCKDCKYGEKANAVYLCGKSRGFGIAHEPDWFCADGERKEGR